MKTKQSPPKKMTEMERLVRAYQDYQAIVGEPLLIVQKPAVCKSYGTEPHSLIVDDPHTPAFVKNEFFNPDTCPFEVIGFSEELTDAATGKVLGNRRIAEPTRRLGSDGLLEFTITETLELSKGHKTVTLKASPKKPRRVIGMLIVLCGRLKSEKIRNPASA